MSDYSELKRLAEAATPGRNFDRYPESGGGLKYECTGDDGSMVLKVDHKNDEWGFVGDNGEADEAFFLACTPAAVLELITEVERLTGGGDLSYAVLLSERRQLKADNEALRKDAARWKFVRNPIGGSSPFAVWSERKDLFLGKYADAAIDAAMSNQAANTCRSEQGPETQESPAQQGSDCGSGLA